MTQRNLYVETSAALRFFLERNRSLAGFFMPGARLLTSQLTAVEAHRALHRARMESSHDPAALAGAQRDLADFLLSCETVALSDEVLARASAPFPVEPIRTLDALHVASAVVLQGKLGPTSVLSCDARVRRNAQALGLEVLP